METLYPGHYWLCFYTGFQASGIGKFSFYIADIWSLASTIARRCSPLKTSSNNCLCLLAYTFATNIQGQGLSTTYGWVLLKWENIIEWPEICDCSAWRVFLTLFEFCFYSVCLLACFVCFCVKFRKFKKFFLNPWSSHDVSAGVVGASALCFTVTCVLESCASHGYGLGQIEAWMR